MVLQLGFERSYLVLKRLGATPLGVPRLVLAKALSVLVVEIVQVILLVGLASLFGADLGARSTLPSWCLQLRSEHSPFRALDFLLPDGCVAR